MAYITHAPLINSQSLAILPRLGATLRLWRRRRRERDELARMSERELRDIGVSPSSVFAELSKPFWRA